MPNPLCWKKLLLTGDSDWKAWKEDIVPNFEDCPVNYENTDILIASHHGSRTFFTREDTINETKYPNTTYTESISSFHAFQSESPVNSNFFSA